MHLKSTLIGLITILFFSGNSFSGNNEWKLYKSIDGVQIFSKVIDCKTKADPKYTDPNQEYCVFKFVNTTLKKVSVNWVFDVWYGENCRTCSLTKAQKSDYTHKIILNENETIEGNCTHEMSSGLSLFYGFQQKENSHKLSKFEMTNLTVVIYK